MRRSKVGKPHAVIGSPPVNTVAPVIAGTTVVGSTLTVTSNGTWTNTPLNFNFQWKRNGSNIGTNSSTYVLVSGDLSANITCLVTAGNGAGIGTQLSNSLGPITASAGLATPTVTNISTAGAIPLILSLTDADYVAGLYLQWEFAASLTPTLNGDGSYATTTQKNVTFIDGDSWARLDLALGYNDPSGAFAFHCRVLRENDAGAITGVVDSLGDTFNADGSAWSTNYTDTISTSVAVLSGTTGVDKSTFLNVATPFHQFIHNNNVGTLCASRATVSQVPTKGHFELVFDNFSSKVYAGLADSGAVTTFATSNGNPPGFSSVPGITVRCGVGATFVDIFNNGGISSPNTPGVVAMVAGDGIIIECNKTTNVVDIYYWRNATTTATLLSSITLTGVYIPTAYYAFGGGNVGNGTLGASDAGTLNCGDHTFLMTPSTGYTYYG